MFLLAIFSTQMSDAVANVAFEGCAPDMYSYASEQEAGEIDGWMVRPGLTVSLSQVCL